MCQTPSLLIHHHHTVITNTGGCYGMETLVSVSIYPLRMGTELNCCPGCNQWWSMKGSPWISTHQRTMKLYNMQYNNKAWSAWKCSILQLNALKATHSIISCNWVILHMCVIIWPNGTKSNITQALTRLVYDTATLLCTIKFFLLDIFDKYTKFEWS